MNTLCPVNVVCVICWQCRQQKHCPANRSVELAAGVQCQHSDFPLEIHQRECICSRLARFHIYIHINYIRILYPLLYPLWIIIDPYFHPCLMSKVPGFRWGTCTKSVLNPPWRRENPENTPDEDRRCSVWAWTNNNRYITGIYIYMYVCNVCMYACMHVCNVCMYVCYVMLCWCYVMYVM